MMPVLIAGAGPAGLVAAGELARRGFAPLVVERRLEHFDHPRATGISTWSMELFRSWGLEPAVREGELDVKWRGWVSETLGADGTEIPLGFPTPEHVAAVSPTGPAAVPQEHLEPVLLRHAESLGASVRLGITLEGLIAGRDGVEAVLAGPDGERRRVRARYLVAADGAYSSARDALGISLKGPGTVVEARSALFRAPLWPHLGQRRYGLYPITHPEAAGVFVPCGRDDRWLYGFTREPGTLDAATYGEREMVRLIRIAAGMPELEPRIEQLRTFAYTALLAERFRHGSAFLAGDAAHRVTPRGGTGMNMAIRGGYDIAWKLAWVLEGWADETLLDTYEEERRPVAAHNVARSADPNGSVRDAADELRVDLGNRIPHAWVDRCSTLDLLGPGVTVFTGPGGSACVRGHTGDAPVTLRRLPAQAAAALGIGPGGSLAVRPDGVPCCQDLGDGPRPELQARAQPRRGSQSRRAGRPARDPKAA